MECLCSYGKEYKLGVKYGMLLEGCSESAFSKLRVSVRIWTFHETFPVTHAWNVMCLSLQYDRIGNYMRIFESQTSKDSIK
jgi:hypothetical protein